MDVSLKIRGVFTTALTKLFLEKGFKIIYPSKIIADRFRYERNIITNSWRIPDVSIKDLQRGQSIYIRGEPKKIKLIIHILKRAFFDVICRRVSYKEYEVEFPYFAKLELDRLRHSVVPTLLGHHLLRSVASECLSIVEEEILSKYPEKRLEMSRMLKQFFIYDTYYEGKKIAIEHVKIDGKLINLSEGEIIHFDQDSKELLLKRSRFYGRSRYDGLNIIKKKGDYAITRVKEGLWFYLHCYFRSDGSIIGFYYNINTPIEFYPHKIRYIDLEVDVIKWSDGEVAIIDEQDLIRRYRSGYLTEALKEKAFLTAEAIKRIL
ncbi:MAG: DUF402 domain-containing protein [Nitrospirae bacterium]|nr:MAG: DUF402 domain-containing protein [Nitrospirota bacterium]